MAVPMFGFKSVGSRFLFAFAQGRFAVSIDDVCRRFVDDTNKARLVEKVLHEPPAPPRQVDRCIPREATAAYRPGV